jgi:hypothetical protein
MYFNDLGRRIQSNTDRCYGINSNNYYKLNNQNINFEIIFERIKNANFIDKNIKFEIFKNEALDLFDNIKKDKDFSQITNGVGIPFLFRNYNDSSDSIDFKFK